MHLRDVEFFGDLALGHALEEAHTEDLSLPRG